MRALAAAAGAVLLAALWLPWFATGGVEGAYFNRDVDSPATAGVLATGPARLDAWSAFAGLDVLLAALAAVVVVTAFARGHRARLAGLVAAVAAVAVVAVRLAAPPDPALVDAVPGGVVFGALDRLSVSPLWGAWLALAAAVAAGIGAARRLARDAEP